MGVMRFLVHPPDDSAGEPDLHRAYLSGLDGRVYPTRVEVNDAVLTCRRQVSESGKLNVAWPVAGFGRPMLSTASLMEREEPYILSVELARGRICQVRDQASAWQLAGMMLPEDFATHSQEAHQAFARAAAIQSEPAAASRLAQAALVHACAAADSVTRSYTRQRLYVRRRKGTGLPAIFGCHLGMGDDAKQLGESFTAAFNAAVVPVEWRLIEPDEGTYFWEPCDTQAEWCRENRLLAIGGPLLDFAPGGLPAWLLKWEHDFFNIQSFFSDFVETAISRYIGRIRHWEIAARGNSGGGLTLTEEHRLMLVARMVETARQVDEEVQLILRVDQPWGDYQARGQHQLSPVQFVDALLRSGVGLSAVNLEISVGYTPRGSASRDLLDVSRLIDQWSGLGIPLNVNLAFPSSNEGDPHANPDLEVGAPAWRSDWSEKSQAEWIDLYLPLLMAKQSVGGIFWAHYADGSPHEFPNAGLVRADGKPKPALARFTQYRRDYSRPE